VRRVGVRARLVLLAVALGAAFLGAPPLGAQMLPGGSLDARPDSSSATGMPMNGLGSALEGPVDPATYVLGPGDELMLEVLGSVTLRIPLEVDPEGNIWIPDHGPLHVAGRTLADAREQLKRSFRGRSGGVVAHLRLVNLRRMVVYVGGEVARPGAFQATAVTRVSEAIRLAGGPTARGSQRNIVVGSVDGTTKEVDLLRFERLGDRAANPYLQAGDRVLVPVARLPVYVHAPVPYPGSYESRPGESLKDLIAIAGGLLPTALPERGRVLRFRDAQSVDTLEVDVARALSGDAPLVLEEGDRVYVPGRSEYHEDRSVTVRGEVERSGVYPIDEGVTRVSEVLARAGGLTPEASPNGILIVRRKATTLERDLEFDRLSRLSRSEMTDNEYQAFRTKLAFAQTTFRVDVDPVTLEASGDVRVPLAARDVALQDGDVIVVERVARSVQVAGEVRLPGLVEFDPARSGQDYIRMAGGYGERAKKGGVRLTRVSTGQTLLLKDARRVEPGDLIYVPEKKDTNWFGVLRDVVALAASIATVVVISRR
jgi:polysaccharide export outer membrane protein